MTIIHTLLVVAFSLVVSVNAGAKNTVVDKCEGPTEPNPAGNVVILTTTCIECVETQEWKHSATSCTPDGKMMVWVCSPDHTKALQVAVPPPAGMYCDSSNGEASAKWSTGQAPQPPPPICKGPKVPSSEGWSVTDGSGATTSSACSSLYSLVGLCCASSKEGGPLDKKVLCEVACPNDSFCTGNACVKGEQPKCYGQAKALAEGQQPVTLKSGDKVLASFSADKTSLLGCLYSTNSGQGILYQYCCHHDPKTNKDSVVICTAPCEDLIANSCCIDGKCVPKAVKCGNGKIDPGEQCDDGNALNGDGCSAKCQTETSAPYCGDNHVNQTSEQCDPPDGTTCDKNCQKLPVCGNGKVDPGEQCDDGNTLDSDGCSTKCTVPLNIPVIPVPKAGNDTVANNTGTTSSEKPSEVRSRPIWGLLSARIVPVSGCSTTQAADGSSWNTIVATNSSTTVNEPTCEDSMTLTGIVCVNNRPVKKSVTCKLGTSCRGGKCVK